VSLRTNEQHYQERHVLVIPATLKQELQLAKVSSSFNTKVAIIHASLAAVPAHQLATIVR
jgi:hypothetical protein